jgi:hypothetical protein
MIRRFWTWVCNLTTSRKRIKEFDRSIETLFSRIPSRMVSSSAVFDLVVAEAWPDQGVDTFLTKGFGCFPLNSWDNGRFLRQELAITLRRGESAVLIEKLFLHLADEAISNGYGFDDGLTYEFDPTPYVKCENKFSCFAVEFGAWMPANCRFESSVFPDLEVVEIVFLTEAERQKYKKNRKGFQRQLKAGKIDVLDLRRF